MSGDRDAVGERGESGEKDGEREEDKHRYRFCVATRPHRLEEQTWSGDGSLQH